MLGMRMEINLRLSIVCTTCGRPNNEHDLDKNCPSYLIAEALENEPTYTCGVCRGQVHVATDDFLKCRRCLTRYSLGELSDSEEPKFTQLYKVRPDEDWVKAYVMKTKGKRGGFKLDLRISMLKEHEKAWKSQRREEKAARRAERASKKNAERRS